MGRFDSYYDPAEFKVPRTMQAVVSAGRGFESVAVRDVEVPDVGSDQLLVRVDAAGVCTSILKLLAQGEDHSFINGWDMQRWPIILGDEGAVTLVRAGENLQASYPLGRRYAIQPAVAVAPILHRERYRDQAKGMQKCAIGYTLGGHLAQYMLIQEEVLAAGCVLPLPDETLPYYAVSMSEPISCIYSAQERNHHIIKDSPTTHRRPHLGLLPGGVTVVVGAGAMGRIHAELALRFKPRALLISDPQPERLDKTMKAIGAKAKRGGTQLLCVAPEELPDAVQNVSLGCGADDLILALGIRAVQQEALALLGHGGVANLFGGLPRGDHMLNLDSLAVHYNEITVVGSSGGDPSDMTATLQAIADDQIDPGNYVAGVGSLDNTIDVLRMIKRTEIDGKVILYPHIQKTPLQRVEHWDRNQEITLLDARL